MAKFELNLSQTYDTPLAAAKGFVTEIITFLETSGITIADKVNADTTANGVTTFTITEPFNAKIKLDVASCAPTAAAATVRTYLQSSANIAIVSNSWTRQCASAGAQLNSQLVLVVTSDYVGLFDKNAVVSATSKVNCRSNVFTAIKAKNLCTGANDWFYNCSTPTVATGYMKSTSMFTGFTAIATNGSLIIATPSEGYVNYPRAKSPFPDGGKYSIRPMEFYDSHVALSTYMCYGMGDEVFSSFTSGEDTYYRDIWFLNKL